MATPKKNSPSNRASRLHTASYLLSSLITPPLCAKGEEACWRKSDMTLAPRVPPGSDQVPGSRMGLCAARRWRGY
ncbi:hypothetical protein GCM10009576_002570 [Streptomyces rhizosphaericus]|uniref:Uncharacterized protein n=2 Tax=Streptomyces rhizosphaericus TaxID=114699 RepID=A0ABN1NRU6_9ACTN